MSARRRSPRSAAPRRRAAAWTGLALTALALSGCADLRSDLSVDPAQPVRAALAENEAAAAREPFAVTGEPAAVMVHPRSADPAPDPRAARGFVRRAGDGRLPPAASGAGTGAALSPAEITLDFNGADLASVVQVMMQEGLGASYIMDPEVTGAVTMRTNRPLKQDEILPTLEEILRLNEAALIERDGVFRIVPRAEAGLSAPVITAPNAERRGLTVTVTPLRHVTVADVAEVLDGFAPVSGAIRYDRSRNLVFSIANPAEQVTLVDLLAALDADYFADRGFALRPLRNADPAPIVDELTQLFATPSGAPNPAIRFLGIERMNAVMAVSEDQALLDDAIELIKRLDQGVGEKPRLHVFPVSNRRATELAKLLGDLFGAAVASRQEDSAVAPGLTPVKISSGSPQPTITASDLGAEGGASVPGAKAEAALADAEPGAGGAAAGGSGAQGVFRIVADESSNVIVAYATAEGARAVSGALRRLDVQPLQVMLEATLLEVTLNDQLSYGVRWFIEDGNFSLNFSDFQNSTPGGSDLFPGFNAAFRTTNAAATISALDEVTDVKVLSSPTLMVLDSQTARLQVGDQVSVTTRSSTSTADPDAPIVTEEEYRDTGVILEIRPTVNAGGLVTLEVRQEVSDVVENSGSANPTFAQRVVQSTIAVQSGDTIALAGLIEEKAEKGRDGVPGLSRLPLLGAAFGASTDRADRSELIVLIRPQVLRDQAGARAATAELAAKLTGLEPPKPEKSLREHLEMRPAKN